MSIGNDPEFEKFQLREARAARRTARYQRWADLDAWDWLLLWAFGLAVHLAANYVGWR